MKSLKKFLLLAGIIVLCVAPFGCAGSTVYVSGGVGYGGYYGPGAWGGYGGYPYGGTVIGYPRY